MKRCFRFMLLPYGCCLCLLCPLVSSEVYWDAQFKYLAGEESSDFVCFYVYQVNCSDNLGKGKLKIAHSSPRVIVETARNTGVSLHHYYNNVTVHCKLQPPLGEASHSVCVTDELSVTGGNMTGQQSELVSGCGSKLDAYNCVFSPTSFLSSASCQFELGSQCVDVWRPFGNISNVWVVGAVLERGYDLIVTVDGSEYDGTRPKRLFLRRPLFPWSFLPTDKNFTAADVAELNPVSDRDILIPVTGSPRSLWTLNLQGSFLISGDNFQTAHWVEYSTSSWFRDQVQSGNFTVDQVIGLSDKVLLSTSNGVWEGRWHEGVIWMLFDSLSVVLNRPVTLELVESPYSIVNVWSVTSDRKRLYVGNTGQGVHSRLREVGSRNDTSLCFRLEVMSSSSDCELISFTVNQLKSSEGILLVSTTNHYVVVKIDQEESIDELQIVATMPSCIASNFTGLMKSDVVTGQPCRPLKLYGMRYVKTSLPYLVAWGSDILVSFDEGRSYYKVAILTGRQTARSFASSLSGHYAVVVDNRILLGHVNKFGFTYLSDATNHSQAFFFSRDNFLYTISINQGNSSGTPCLDRKLLWTPMSSYNNGMQSTVCERVSWQTTTWSVTNTSYFTRQHVTRSPVMMNDSDASLQSSTDHQLRRLANSSGSDKGKFRRVSIAVVKNRLNLRFEAAPAANPVGICDEPVLWEQTLPTVIYLNRHDVYRFAVIFTNNCSESRRIEEDQTQCLDQVHLSIHVTSRHYLSVAVEKTIDYVYSRVQYTVEVQDRGVPTTQHQPGEGMLISGLHLQGWQRSRECVSNETNDILYNHPLTVLLGCPPGLLISFDARSTAAVSDPNWNENCDGPQQTSPCFDYDTVFRPQFRVMDLVTETSTLYNNFYTINVIGMGTGLTEESIALFTDIERFNYNSVNGSSALWTRADGQIDRSVFQGSAMNGINWVCGPGSPCNELKPPSATVPIKLYLLIEFSNRNVSQDYCDFAFQFIIQLRSIPIGSLTIITALLTTFSLLVTLLLAMYIFHTCAIGSKLQTLFHQIQLWIHRVVEGSRVHPDDVTGEDGQSAEKRQ